MKPSEKADRLRLLALSLSPNIGAATLESLLAHFNRDLPAILAASPARLMRAPGVGKAIAREIAAIDLPRLERDWQAWRQRGLELLTPGCPAYPPPLRALADRPPALFTTCPPHVDWAKAMAIVGTRQPSKEARFLALQLAMALARAGWTVVSGLALGIDSAAHTGALAADGATVAVLGSGLHKIYPQSNAELAAAVRAGGALLSETRPHYGAKAQRLVARNRIISGLSRAIIVVESEDDGGAMYTARFASEQGRPVYAFDLPASGNRRLIAAGAAVLSRDDPLAGLGLARHLTNLEKSA